jgi:hypothetical protein
MILQLQFFEGTRNKKDKDIIAKRLQNYFNKKYTTLLKGWRNGIRNALVLRFSGISLMVLSSYINFLDSKEFYPHLPLVLFEPGA